MYNPEKMMNGKPPTLHPTSLTGPSSCFTGGRYSPTYRSPDPMRRCMTNTTVSHIVYCFILEGAPIFELVFSSQNTVI